MFVWIALCLELLLILRILQAYLNRYHISCRGEGATCVCTSASDKLSATKALTFCVGQTQVQNVAVPAKIAGSTSARPMFHGASCSIWCCTRTQAVGIENGNPRVRRGDVFKLKFRPPPFSIQGTQHSGISRIKLLSAYYLVDAARLLISIHCRSPLLSVLIFFVATLGVQNCPNVNNGDNDNCPEV